VIRLVVGLGNPGPKYEGTRHNVGRRVVQSLRDSRFPVPCLVTESFMNDSGRDVAREIFTRKLSPEDILVVLDEFQIPLKQVKILKAGSDGGHNGLESVLKALKTESVPRLRIGIGPLPAGKDPAEFVLERFSAEENRIVDQLMDRFEKAVHDAVQQGLDAAMNKYNGVTE
jgi:peptidyl-tRNA hydrolase, PTH1 family